MPNIPHSLVSSIITFTDYAVITVIKRRRARSRHGLVINHLWMVVVDDETVDNILLCCLVSCLCGNWPFFLLFLKFELFLWDGEF